MKLLDSIALPVASVTVEAHGQQAGRLLGSAFHLNRTGAIATARHVVEDFAGPIQVGLRLDPHNSRSTTWLPAPRWDFAPNGVDIAVTQIPFECEPFFDASRLHNGIWQEVVTCGFPESGFRFQSDGFAATQLGLRGYITATHKRPEILGIKFRGEIIQLDFAVPRGVSGAPLMARVGSEVQLIGICVGNWETEQVDYQVLHVNDDGREYREVKTRAELHGLAASFSSILDWSPPLIGRPFEEILECFRPRNVT